MGIETLAEIMELSRFANQLADNLRGYEKVALYQGTRMGLVLNSDLAPGRLRWNDLR